ncbi:MAG: glycosyltransferase family 2 protein [Fimbriimonadaceae bacterium]
MARGGGVKLTIAIPTYDRPVALAKTLGALAPQLTADVELLVLDNASPTPAQLPPEASSASERRLIRHATNIGATGNVLRCFEEASAPWIWVLGDDDMPVHDAVRVALKAIHEHDQAVAINFNSVYGAGSQDFSTIGRADLIDRFPAFGNLLFISSNLYRRAPMMEHLHMGYRYCYSMAPHLAMLLFAAGTEGEVVFLNDVLVETETAIDGNHWSAINQALSIPTLLELPLSPSERKRFAGRFQLPDVLNQIVQLLGTGLRRGEFATSMFYYREITGRLWPFTPTRQRLFIKVCGLAFLFPHLSIRLANRLLRHKKGSSVLDRLRADTFDRRL